MTEINAGSIIESINRPIIEEYNRIKLKTIPKEGPKALYQEELNNRARVAAFFGTLQAGFTNFHYLRDVWQETTEKDALIGVGMTGIASGDVLDLDLTEASTYVDAENKRVAALIGINEAARKTTIKPSGTTSIVVGSSSGIHSWFAKYYLRSMQVATDSELAKYFFANHPKLIKVMDRDAKSSVIGIPQKAPDGAILRENENAIEMLNRVFKFYDKWVKPGHLTGSNSNNVSATVFVDASKEYYIDSEDPARGKQNEWIEVGNYLWENKDKFNGMSVLPYDGGSYVDAPFQVITEERFNELYPLTLGIDLTKVQEYEDNTDLSNELACAGGNCDVK